MPIKAEAMFCGLHAGNSPVSQAGTFLDGTANSWDGEGGVAGGSSFAYSLFGFPLTLLVPISGGFWL